jgi:hypothetical protein
MIRIKSGNVFSGLQNLKGTELNAVLIDGKTYFGKLLAVTTDLLTLVDSKQHHHQIPITGVYEIIYDYESK